MIYALELSVLLALVAVTAGSLSFFPKLGQAVFGPLPSRMAELDGLRGVLSILVVVHHCVIFRIFAATGIYDSPPSNVENLAGDASVSLFFIITGYLLWGRMLRTGGQADWRQFYIGRFRRLTPMYMLSIACLVIIVLFETGFTLHVSVWEFVQSVLRWMAFALLPQSDINGLPDTHAILVVLWTLKYEWVFYLAIPLLAVFADERKAWILYGAALLIAVGLADAPLYGYFVAGAVSAHLARYPGPFKLSPNLWAAVSVAALLAMCLFFRHIYGLPQIGLMFLVFQGMLTGRGPWRLLRAKPLMFLGTISYSTYLLHHMVLHLTVFKLLGASSFAALDDWGFAAVGLAVGVVSIGLAICTYLWVEQPGMRQNAA